MFYVYECSIVVGLALIHTYPRKIATRNRDGLGQQSLVVDERRQVHPFWNLKRQYLRPFDEHED